MSEKKLVEQPEKQLVTQPEKRRIIKPEIQFMIPPEKPRVKHKLKALNLETRMKVIEDAAAGLSQRKLAEKYECSKTQIHKILQKKEIIKEKWRKNANKNTRKETFQPYREINDLTLAWVEWARTQNISINGRYLREIASSYAKHLQIEKFSASTGWLEKFCRRNNIVFKNVSNENKSIESKIENKNNVTKSQCVKSESVEPICENVNVDFQNLGTENKSIDSASENVVVDWLQALPSLIKDYDFKNIYNVDETILCYQSLHSKSLTCQDPAMFDAETVKQRITVMLCVNALGEKEAPLIVNNSLQPKCFKNLCMSELGVEWYANQKCWMTSSIFIDWIENFNSKMKKENRKVLLILDNTPCHPKISLSNVILLFLPSKSQPLNLGIIKLFKLQYQRRLLTSVFAFTNAVGNVNEIIKQITLADAVEYVKEAWSCVNENTIKNSFKKSVINCKLPEDIHAEEIIVQTENEVIALSQQLGIDIKINFEEEFQVNDNWEEDSLEMQAIASSSKEEVLIKEESEECPAVSLNEALNYVNRLKELGRNLGNNKMVDLLYGVQTLLEKEVINHKTNSSRQPY